MTLAERTSPALILPRLSGMDAAGVLEELSRTLQQAGLVPDLLRFYHAALNRELLITSEVEAGIAFPHVRGYGIPGLAFALGRSESPIAWGTNATRAVRLVFLIAIPEGDSLDYLNLASSLSRLSKSPLLVRRLVEATGKDEILGILGEVRVRDSGHPVLLAGIPQPPVRG